MSNQRDNWQAWVSPEPNTGCWLWIGRVNHSGYGLAVGDRKDTGKYDVLRAHRVVYEAVKGPIPTGLVIDHLCRQRSCVNPDHMEAVTNGENVRRGHHKGKRAGTHNKRKTACPQGHPYDDTNTYWCRGHRQCRTCRARHRAAQMERERQCR